MNAFEPGADVWLLILRAWYENYAKDWVRLATIPGGQRSALLLSHDVDWENSFAPGLDFARIEKANQAKEYFFHSDEVCRRCQQQSLLFRAEPRNSSTTEIRRLD